MGKRKKRRLARASAPASFREASASYRRMRKAGYYSLDQLLKIAKNVDKKLAIKDEEIALLKADVKAARGDIQALAKAYDDERGDVIKDVNDMILLTIDDCACVQSCGTCAGCKYAKTQFKAKNLGSKRYNEETLEWGEAGIYTDSYLDDLYP